LFDFDQNPRATALRIRAALKANGCAREISTDIGSMARALAGSKTAGNFLCIGAGAGEVGGWVLDAMDHSSGLVALVQDADEAAVLRRELDRDLRASVHLQDAESFLVDVREHRFDLIVDLVADEHSRAVRLGLGLLQMGGVYLASHPGNLSRETLAKSAPDPAEQSAPFGPEDFEIARCGGQLESLIIVRRAEPARPRRRSNPKA
jgi:predicted O-methyltransferase YrrM